MANTQKHFGYQRVSTTGQNLDRQFDALTTAGIDAELIFSDKISGTRQSRPGLDALLKQVREGDTITVQSFDRLGRTSLHVFQTLEALEQQGVQVITLKASEQQFSGATGKFMRDLLILVAELERSMNAERVAEARAAKAARTTDGAQVAGRPRSAMTPDKIAAVHALHAKGMKPAQIATNQNISRASIYRILELVN